MDARKAPLMGVWSLCGFSALYLSFGTVFATTLLFGKGPDAG